MSIRLWRVALAGPALLLTLAVLTLAVCAYLLPDRVPF